MTNKNENEKHEKVTDLLIKSNDVCDILAFLKNLFNVFDDLDLKYIL